jgi:hypothetical protein
VGIPAREGRDLLLVRPWRRGITAKRGITAWKGTASGVTVWYFQPAGRLLHWREGDNDIPWPAGDAYGAAVQIAAACGAKQA